MTFLYHIKNRHKMMNNFNHPAFPLQVFLTAQYNSALLSTNIYTNSSMRPYEPEHDKTNKMTFAPSEVSDQPGL